MGWQHRQLGVVKILADLLSGVKILDGLKIIGGVKMLTGERGEEENTAWHCKPVLLCTASAVSTPPPLPVPSSKL